MFQDCTPSPSAALVVHQLREVGVIASRFTFVKELGSGSFGVVWLVRACTVLHVSRGACDREHVRDL